MVVEIEIIRDLAVVMVIAAAVTFLFYRLRQPIILGYLVAGMIIGPYTPPFSLVSQIEFLRIFAEFGVILLLFAIGLEFPITRLRKIGKISLGVGLLEIMLLLAVGYFLGFVFGWSTFDALFLAAALSISSTTIIVKVLDDYGILNEGSSTIMLGILIIEDIAAVIMIASLQSLATLGKFQITEIVFIFGKVILFVGGTLIIGSLVIPKLIDKLVSLKNRELTIISAIGLCFALSFIASILGFAVATGAFLAGVLIAGSKSAKDVIYSTAPLKEMFAALFFVSVGALMDLQQIPTFLVPAIVITLATIGAKFLGVSLGVRVFGHNTLTSVRTGLGMAQIGEFSFIIIRAGLDLNVISSFLFPLVGVVASITTLLTPYLIKLGKEDPFGLAKRNG
ncbi:MAG: cation:proton antiporter [Thaumarchaeota archaeon]|nr:cation:proton antiporter [Nitrososphaerota archaeon]